MFTDCDRENCSSRYHDSQVQMKIEVDIDPVIVLPKASAISLSRLIFVLNSSEKDTIRDTLTSSTTPSLNVTSTVPQELERLFILNPLRSWKVVATVKDAKDSVIHKDSATTEVLYAGDKVQVNLSLSSRYTEYVATLNSPDSISSATPGTVKQVLHLNRLILSVDGVIKVDSFATPSPYFTPLGTVILPYDYLTAGSHTIKLSAYGPMGSWDVSNPLFSGATTINVGAGADSATPFILYWVGPTSGTGSISVTIGKIGKVIVNTTIPGLL